MTATPQSPADRARKVWEATDYQPIATRDVLVSELLARAADVRSGQRVLDVAAGSGNTALAAARRGARVTAADVVPGLLETASRRAAVEGLELGVEVADAQELPFADGSFDVVLSSFGVMYAPDQRRAAAELLRVCRPRGRVGLVSWTPTGLTARLQKVMAAFLPAPRAASGPPPVMWGDEDHCRGLFGAGAASVRSRVRVNEWCAPSAVAQVEFLVRHLPPWHAAFGRLDPEARRKVSEAAAAEIDGENRAEDGTLVAEAEYLELVATVA
ncbi:class I SAM-dependent methyltransferase [Actinomadura litoris]|uniref:class I SAM-dependent methyltransferase n=1 Tax=Actinomadura litoris TaxID=2678616 RepID=UPI001FA76598|nr:class I SAM-dependent methyltransferase [Actinomadura litoris]